MVRRGPGIVVGRRGLRYWSRWRRAMVSVRPPRPAPPSANHL